VKILVVDDNFRNLRYFVDVLEAHGHEVVSASGAQEALGLLEGVDVVLMDIQMPGMGGTEAMRRIKRSWDALPVIAVTAHAMPGDELLLAREGFDGYVSKPVTMDGLLRAIDAVMAGKRSPAT
jgi:two-component system, cell cycle response regulator DivK